MRNIVKKAVNVFALACVSPASLSCWVEKRIDKDSEIIFQFWSHCFALIPGFPGVLLRRAHYALTLQQCSLNCYVGFGSLFTHRDVIVEDNVYMGNYVICGTSKLGARTIIASRVSITSGKHLHTRTPEGRWEPATIEKMECVKIGPDAWIGEAAVVMASVGKGSLVGAGAVVTKPIGNNVTAAGNPARIIKEF